MNDDGAVGILDAHQLAHHGAIGARHRAQATTVVEADDQLPAELRYLEGDRAAIAGNGVEA